MQCYHLAEKRVSTILFCQSSFSCIPRPRQLSPPSNLFLHINHATIYRTSCWNVHHQNAKVFQHISSISYVYGVVNVYRAECFVRQNLSTCIYYSHKQTNRQTKILLCSFSFYYILIFLLISTFFFTSFYC